MSTSTRSHSHSDLMTHKVAVLACQGLKQQQIVERLKSSQPTVSRKMKQAQEQGLIVIPPPIWQGPREVRAEVERLLHPVAELRAELRASSTEAERLLEVQILENPLDAIRRDEPRSQSDFAGRVAAYLLDELPKGGTVGVAWGRTLNGVATAVEQLIEEPLEGFEDLAFVPICGDPPEVDQSPVLSAATIAARLETALTGKKEFVHSFSSVASCIPDRFTGAEVETIRAFFRSFPGYETVFGRGRSQRGGLITKLDGILTSLGTNKKGANWLEAASRAAGIEPEALAAASAGNIGGLFVERRNASAGDRRLVARVNERWTGFRFEHLERCARAAASQPDRLGVVVIAGRGAEQAGTVHECVRRGYVNRLVLDPETTKALRKLL